MDRIGSAKRKRESPDEDEVSEILQTIETTRKVVGQVPHQSTPRSRRGSLLSFCSLNPADRKVVGQALLFPRKNPYSREKEPYSPMSAGV